MSYQFTQINPARCQIFQNPSKMLVWSWFPQLLKCSLAQEYWILYSFGLPNWSIHWVLKSLIYNTILGRFSPNIISKSLKYALSPSLSVLQWKSLKMSQKGKQKWKILPGKWVIKQSTHYLQWHTSFYRRKIMKKYVTISV